MAHLVAGGIRIGSASWRLWSDALFEFALGEHFDGAEEVAFEGDGFVALTLLPQFAVFAVAL